MFGPRMQTETQRQNKNYFIEQEKAKADGKVPSSFPSDFAAADGCMTNFFFSLQDSQTKQQSRLVHSCAGAVRLKLKS